MTHTHIGLKEPENNISKNDDNLLFCLRALFNKKTRIGPDYTISLCMDLGRFSSQRSTRTHPMD